MFILNQSMDKKLQRIILVKLILAGIVSLSHCQGTLCITADKCITGSEIYECPNISESSSWAVGASLTVNHTFSPGISGVYIIYYYLESATICSYQYNGATACTPWGNEPNCVSCLGKGTSIETVISLPNMDITKNSSNLTYSTGVALPLQQFILRECPSSVEEATSVGPLPDTCGFGCTTQFECANKADGNSSETHCCSAKADWEPGPLCTSETTTEDSPISTTVETTQDNSNPETATSDITTNFISTTIPSVGIPTTKPESTTSQGTSTTSTSSSNATQGSDCGECDYCCSKQQDAAIAITVIGCLFVAVEIGIAIYSFINKPGVQNAKFLYAAFVVCAVAWIASVIVLFVGDCTCTEDTDGDCTCTADNCTCVAYIAGATIGGISIAGMAVSIGFLISAIAAIKQEAKSTPGRRKEN